MKAIAICDTEALFVSRFLAAVQSHLRQDIEVFGATTWESVQALEGQAGFWIFGESFWREDFLRRHRDCCVLLSSGFVAEWLDGYPVILKYQSKDKLLRGIFRSSGWKNFIGKERKIKTGSLEITSIYAPGGGNGQLLFSLAYAFWQARKQEVLYVNLQENSGLYQLFSFEEEVHLGDLVCHLRQPGAGVDIRGYWQRFGNLNMILPLQQGTQAAEITAEDINSIYRCLTRQGFCGQLVLDWGKMTAGFADVFAESGRRILVTEKNSLAQAAKRQFLENMRVSGKEGPDGIKEFCWQETPAEMRSGEALLEELLNGAYQRLAAEWGENVDNGDREFT